MNASNTRIVTFLNLIPWIPKDVRLFPKKALIFRPRGACVGGPIVRLIPHLDTEVAHPTSAH